MERLCLESLCGRRRCGGSQLSPGLETNCPPHEAVDNTYHDIQKLMVGSDI